MKTKRNTTPKAAPSPEARIIRACCTYTSGMAAYSASFLADSTGEGTFAVPVGERRRREAYEALGEAAGIKATTALAVDAKALATFFMVDELGGQLEDAEEAFIKAFADDVHRFVDRLAAQERKAARQGVPLRDPLPIAEGAAS